MARNVEIKAHVSDLAAVRRRAAALATGPGELLTQTDTFFTVSNGRLKVRELADGAGELIAYARSDQSGPKESEYSIVRCADAQTLSKALESGRFSSWRSFCEMMSRWTLGNSRRMNS